MRTYAKLPLYIGLFILVISVLFSAVIVGETRQARVSQSTRASLSGVSLALMFHAPDTISVQLSQNLTSYEVAGVNIAIKYDQSKIEILPSTLYGGSSFTTSGGLLDPSGGIFSFAALAREENITSGIVSTFKIRLKESEGISAVGIVDDPSYTAVIEKGSNRNILSSVSAVNIDPDNILIDR